MLLPHELLGRARPLTGQLLIYRHSEPHCFGHIIIPESYRRNRRPPFATIVAVAPDVDPEWELAVGDVIAVTAAAGKRIEFGTGRDRIVLYTCRPQFVIAGVERLGASAFEEKGEALEGRHQFEHATDRMVEEGRAEHGLRK